MQVVTELQLERLHEEPLIYANNQNTFAYLTQSQLVLTQLEQAKTVRLRVRGEQVLALSLENLRFVVLVMDSGQLQVRRVDSLSEVFLRVQSLAAEDDIPSIRVSESAVYIISAQSVERIWLSLPARRELVHVSQQLDDFVIDLLVSPSLRRDKLLIYHFPTAVSLTIDGLPTARISLHDVQQIKLLRHPSIPLSRQFLAVIDRSKYLKVYDLCSLKQVAEKEFPVQKNEELEINVEWNNEYLVMRVYEIMGMKTKRNMLLRINTEYYTGDCKRDFLILESNIPICEDLLIFPFQREVVQSAEYDSIDVCYFSGRNVKKLTMRVDRSKKTKVAHLKMGGWDNSENEDWADILQSFKNMESSDQEAERQPGNSEEWDRFVAKFVQENTPNFKQQPHSSLQNIPKQKQHFQDALNTLSGSSHHSTHQIEERILKIMQSSLLPSEDSGNHPVSEQNQESLTLQQQSQSEQYFSQIETQIAATTQPILQKNHHLSTKMGRFEQVHLRKILDLNRRVKGYAAEAIKLPTQIEQWCGQQMNLFAAEVKDSLKQFTANVGRLEMLGLRNLKKLKKGYRDYLQETVEVCQERAERSETSTLKIEALISKLEAI